MISIIALLIALLLPALTAAREMAVKTNCLSNLRQIGIGSTAYTADNDGYWPLRFRGDTHPFIEERLSWTYFTGGQAHGFGALYANGYVTDTRAMWCPAMENEGWKWGKNGQPAWELRNPDSGDWRTAYNWNPYTKEVTKGGTTDFDTAWWRVDEHPADRTFIVDLLSGWTSAHSRTQPTFNILKGDGSAMTGVESELIYDEIRVRGEPSNRDRMIDYLETLEGRGYMPGNNWK